MMHFSNGCPGALPTVCVCQCLLGWLGGKRGKSIIQHPCVCVEGHIPLPSHQCEMRQRQRDQACGGKGLGQRSGDTQGWHPLATLELEDAHSMETMEASRLQVQLPSLSWWRKEIPPASHPRGDPQQTLGPKEITGLGPKGVTGAGPRALCMGASTPSTQLGGQLPQWHHLPIPRRPWICGLPGGRR